MLEIRLRELADQQSSKIDMEYRRERNITKSEDLAWIIYMNDEIMFEALQMPIIQNQLRDLSFRGGGIDSVILVEDAEFPKYSSTIQHGDSIVGILWTINPNPKCSRCWKRELNINAQKLCNRCADAVEYYDFKSRAKVDDNQTL